MSLLPLAALAAGAAPAKTPDAQPATPQAKPVCQDKHARLVASTRRGTIHPLAQEPNADAVLTVLRSENGCSRPVKVREDIGARQR
ncbi:hypothetical protein [uncultured Sphingomonas sp.]|uniref:hypothetical protein n=1 Tax=uncultured Sphingomonas sp. TaxID=158754 RepID=UPI0025CD876D|nr:hypothetical protein [uncultured Sphingomonas sp.]